MATLHIMHEELRVLNFWLNGYRRMFLYRNIADKLAYGDPVIWNTGVGAAASFTRTISGIALEAFDDVPWDHVMKVELKPTSTEEEAARGRSARRTSIEEQLTVAVAEKLGLLDLEYCRRKEAVDELRYYTYGLWLEKAMRLLGHHLSGSVVPRIRTELLNKRYLLVVDNLYEPMEPNDFSENVGLFPPWWTSSRWLISTTSRDVYDKSKVLLSFSEDEVLALILSAVHQSAKYIYTAICHGDEQYWHHVAIRCFHYTIMLFARYSPPQGNTRGDVDHPSSNAPYITSDELIRQWAAQGILTATKPRVQESIEEETSCYRNKHHGIYQVGNVILQAFREYSLLQLPFSPATEAAAATETAAQFLAYHNLIAEGLIIDKFFYDKEYLEKLKWISLMDDQGWHVSREWLSQETIGPSALVLRHYPQRSSLFAQLDHFLVNLPCLGVLDLSYTPLESLPPSVWCLLNLQLLSLRGCRNLKNLCSFSDNEASVPQKNSNKKMNLLYLDLSYSHIHTIQRDFFQNTPNLRELLLVECSSLVELPPSMAALSNPTTLELAGTPIKSLCEKIFEETKKLQSFKLIDNKKLTLPGAIYKVHGLIELHIEGCMLSTAEIKLDGHPTLRSFSLIDAPHIRRLSLRGCRKLEFVDFRDLGALEELDLSSTAIKELPADIPNLRQLRRLLLMDVPSLRRFPWHKLQRLPKVFCFDHCAYGTGHHCDQVTYVCTSDSRLFHSFSYTTRVLVKHRRFLHSFYIRVAPCMVKIRKLEDEEDMVAKNLHELVHQMSHYTDVYCHYTAEGVSIVPIVTPPIRQTERHVEISAMDRYPNGLSGLLGIAKSITMTDDTFVSCLNDLSDYLEHLEECKLQWCHQMKQVFTKATELRDTLKNVWVSQLKNLVHFYVPKEDYTAFSDFRSLKHLHLEDCPRLKDIMPCGPALPSLTTLDILFCYNLKTIFSGPGLQGDSYQLPCLQRICLQELPQLKHFREDDAVITAPMWKHLHIRGCWSLRRLPRLREDQPNRLEVSGERAWWAKLCWGTPPHRDSYEPKLAPAFASFDERAEVTSYLR